MPKVNAIVQHWWTRGRELFADIGRRFPEVVILWSGWGTLLLVSTYLSTGLSHPLPVWYDAVLAIVGMWRDFLGWSCLLALTYRLCRESQLPLWRCLDHHLPVGCQSLMLSVISGLILELSTGGLWRQLQEISPPASFSWWWTQILLGVRVGLVIMIVSCGVYYLLLVKKKRSLSTLIVYLIHFLSLSLIFGGIVCVGVILALALIEWLFDVSTWRWYVTVATATLLVWPSLALLLIVPSPEQDLHQWTAHKFWRVCYVYLLQSLLIIYDLILYVYLVRQLWHWEWPRFGMINLTLWFCLTTMIWLLTSDYYRLTKNKKTMSFLYARCLCLSLMPLIGLAFYGLWQRVLAFGWTLPRFWVACGLLWVVIAGLCWWRRQAIAILLVSAVTAVVACILGPMIVSWSQLSRLGDGWLETISPGWSHTTQESKSQHQRYYFYGDASRLLKFYPDISSYDYLVTTSRTPTITTLDAGLQVTWPATADYQGTSASGVLTVNRGDQLLAQINVNDLLADLNRACQRQSEDERSDYYYGCRDENISSIVLETLQPQGLEHLFTGGGASWHWENEYIRGRVLLWQWQGDYEPATSQQSLDSVEGMFMFTVTPTASLSAQLTIN